MYRTAIPLILTALASLAGCGPSHAQIDPKEVVNVNVRPASGQLLYCPGDAFQIEVVAKLKDGTSCSNVDPKRGCKGESNMVIAPELVHVKGSNGKRGDNDDTFIWVPDRDLLSTADTGLKLEAWLEGAKGVKSDKAEAALKPVYECQNQQIIPGPLPPGQAAKGYPGVEVTVSITTLSTPFYPDAALIRVDWVGSRAYLISPSSDKPVKIIAQGGPGGPGKDGIKGADGQAGDNAKEECGTGTDGQAGQAGTNGSRGGDGGPGGQIKVLLDDANADKLKGRLLLVSEGGLGGQGGRGGLGGFGGQGGRGGELKAGDPKCKPESGKNGQNGPSGRDGPSGQNGPSGPAPIYEMAKRQVTFANELSTIQRIESGKAK